MATDQVLSATAIPQLPPALGGKAHVPGGPRHGGGPGGGTTTPPAATPPANALTPLQQFANSAGMQFQLEQGANALNNLYAARGAVNSGAAAKALQDYGQHTALQNYFFPYMNYLSGQQAMGAQAASAIAGVGSSFGNTMNGLGQNYSNAVQGINQNAANAIGQGALNIGNANANNAALRGYANAQLGNTIGTQLGNLGSSFFSPHY